MTQDIWSNITLCLQENSWAWPSGTPSGKGLYLTTYPLSRPNTDTVYYMSGGISRYVMYRVSCSSWVTQQSVTNLINIKCNRTNLKHKIEDFIFRQGSPVSNKPLMY